MDPFYVSGSGCVGGLLLEIATILNGKRTEKGHIFGHFSIISEYFWEVATWRQLFNLSFLIRLGL